MNIETKELYFREVVQHVKNLGFDVWAPKRMFDKNDSVFTGSRYAWVTDGTNLLYFQIDDLRGVKWSTECIPSHETGSGHSLNLPALPTKEDIISSFKTLWGKPYRNFEHFKEKHWTELIQIL